MEVKGVEKNKLNILNKFFLGTLFATVMKRDMIKYMGK